MSRRATNATLLAVFALLVAVGSAHGQYISHLRQSADFYKWIFAAATSQRLFEAESTGADYELLRDIEAAASGRIAEVAPGAGEDGDTLGIVRLVRDPGFDREVWRLASSGALAEQRAAFASYARADELEFAQGLDLSAVQDSGANLFNVFFGFRKIAANFLWLQVDRLWHEGNIYAMVPLMRTCVTLDPNFVDAYLLGAWHLAYNATARMPATPRHLQEWDASHQTCVGEKEKFYYFAVDFLRDGIRSNPRNFKLYFDLGFAVYGEKLADYENAVRYLEEAVRLPHERWVPRQLFLAYERNDEFTKAFEGWKSYSERFPDNPVAPRFIERAEALAFEQRSEGLYAEAEAAADPQTAAALRAEGDEYWQQARQRWENLADTDPFAAGRLARRQAMALAEEGRYAEAIGVLDKARWESATFFEEASEMMIEYKQAGDIPLSKSEREAVAREQDRRPCIGQPQNVADTQA